MYTHKTELELLPGESTEPGLRAARTLTHDSVPTHIVIVQELCESRGGRPELSVLTSLLVSVDVKNY